MGDEFASFFENNEAEFGEFNEEVKMALSEQKNI